ncbi:MAG: hypothetical protein COV45_07925 [Deltaproteobacteria bacterium CG11_big_fil_rev_8_21_14_0_20_47_16]|nr:MAG: hypothetical protein COV45_07925 [Deltaproteobacteria bacterium CG11_big_fil_rev_8_21_14_0_20_47_16]
MATDFITELYNNPSAYIFSPVLHQTREDASLLPSSQTIANRWAAQAKTELHGTDGNSPTGLFIDAAVAERFMHDTAPQLYRQSGMQFRESVSQEPDATIKATVLGMAVEALRFSSDQVAFFTGLLELGVAAQQAYAEHTDSVLRYIVSSAFAVASDHASKYELVTLTDAMDLRRKTAQTMAQDIALLLENGQSAFADAAIWSAAHYFASGDAPSALQVTAQLARHLTNLAVNAAEADPSIVADAVRLVAFINTQLSDWDALYNQLVPKMLAFVDPREITHNRNAHTHLTSDQADRGLALAIAISIGEHHYPEDSIFERLLTSWHQSYSEVASSSIVERRHPKNKIQALDHFLESAYTFWDAQFAGAFHMINQGHLQLRILSSSQTSRPATFVQTIIGLVDAIMGELTRTMEPVVSERLEYLPADSHFSNIRQRLELGRVGNAEAVKITMDLAHHLNVSPSTIYDIIRNPGSSLAIQTQICELIGPQALGRLIEVHPLERIRVERTRMFRDFPHVRGR